ncbi:hypothetical protein TIFTF001_046996 [Ficus carica]|uniref:Uncharacterized protein n=1 Tax=Ficus carica TaxID=3494 RepID=A0AA87YPW3_FICCA|nr:hypothetical protein TIFTF001_046996 [Ficus carica]
MEVWLDHRASPDVASDHHKERREPVRMEDRLLLLLRRRRRCRRRRSLGLPLTTSPTLPLFPVKSSPPLDVLKTLRRLSYSPCSFWRSFRNSRPPIRWSPLRRRRCARKRRGPRAAAGLARLEIFLALEIVDLQLGKVSFSVTVAVIAMVVTTPPQAQAIEAPGGDGDA